MKKQKGFTLAELLIVMAILAVLAAIAIPNFARQLESSRETNDLNVMRAAYSEAMTLYMTKYATTAPEFVVISKQVKFAQKQDDWQYADVRGTDNGGSMPWNYYGSAATSIVNSTSFSTMDGTGYIVFTFFAGEDVDDLGNPIPAFITYAATTESAASGIPTGWASDTLPADA